MVQADSAGRCRRSSAPLTTLRLRPPSGDSRPVKRTRIQRGCCSYRRPRRPGSGRCWRAMDCHASLDAAARALLLGSDLSLTENAAGSAGPLGAALRMARPPQAPAQPSGAPIRRARVLWRAEDASSADSSAPRARVVRRVARGGSEAGRKRTAAVASPARQAADHPADLGSTVAGGFRPSMARGPAGAPDGPGQAGVLAGDDLRLTARPGAQKQAVPAHIVSGASTSPQAADRLDASLDRLRAELTESSRPSSAVRRAANRAARRAVARPRPDRAGVQRAEGRARAAERSAGRVGDSGASAPAAAGRAVSAGRPVVRRSTPVAARPAGSGAPAAAAGRPSRGRSSSATGAAGKGRVATAAGGQVGHTGSRRSAGRLSPDNHRPQAHSPKRGAEARVRDRWDDAPGLLLRHPAPTGEGAAAGQESKATRRAASGAGEPERGGAPKAAASRRPARGSISGGGAAEAADRAGAPGPPRAAGRSAAAARGKAGRRSPDGAAARSTAGTQPAAAQCLSDSAALSGSGFIDRRDVLVARAMATASPDGEDGPDENLERTGVHRGLAAMVPGGFELEAASSTSSSGEDDDPLLSPRRPMPPGATGRFRRPPLRALPGVDAPEAEVGPGALLPAGGAAPARLSSSIESTGYARAFRRMRRRQGDGSTAGDGGDGPAASTGPHVRWGSPLAETLRTPQPAAAGAAARAGSGGGAGGRTALAASGFGGAESSESRARRGLEEVIAATKEMVARARATSEARKAKADSLDWSLGSTMDAVPSPGPSPGAAPARAGSRPGGRAVAAPPAACRYARHRAARPRRGDGSSVASARSAVSEQPMGSGRAAVRPRAWGSGMPEAARRPVPSVAGQSAPEAGGSRSGRGRSVSGRRYHDASAPRSTRSRRGVSARAVAGRG